MNDSGAGSGGRDAAILRAAGLRVTAARLAVLRLAPELLARKGRVSPQDLFAAARRHGYTASLPTFYRVLVELASRGLLPDGMPGPGDGRSAAAAPPPADR